MQKTNISRLMVVFVVFVAALVVVGLYGDKVERDILALSGTTQTLAPGKVAGVATQEVQFILDDGKARLGYQFDLAGKTTAFDLLERLRLQQNMVVETKQYDYGVLVDSINGNKNGDGGKYWIYYVNGQTAQVSMDKYELKAGDVVELRFEKGQ